MWSSFRSFTVLSLLGLMACREGPAVDIARGNVLRNRGEREAAIAAYLEASKKGPRDPNPLVLLGNVYMDVGRIEEARAAYSQALQLSPTATEPMLGLASADDKLGKAREAEDILRKVLDLQPDHPYAKLSLAEILLRRGEAGESARHAEAVLVRLPKDPTALYVFGSALTALKDYARAREIFDRLEKASPNGPMAPYGRARVAALSGDRAGAIRELALARSRSKADLGDSSDPAFATLGTESAPSREGGQGAP